DAQTDVEDEVAGLPQVPALRAHRLVVVPDHTKAPAPQRFRGRRSSGGDVTRIRELDVLVEPGEVARRARWLRPEGLPVQPAPRDDAADEGDHEQQVDRGEPDGRVDVEEPQAVQP